MHYFLAGAPYQDIQLIKKVDWTMLNGFKVAEILDLNFYEDILPIVTKAVTMLVGRGGK